jgi:SAM-dependent methyltransferase
MAGCRLTPPEPTPADRSMAPEPLQQFHQDHFGLRRHLLSHLGVEPEDLEERLRQAQRVLRDLGEVSFDWDDPEAFYSQSVREEYLYELSAWHEQSADYIGDTIALERDWARGDVLDFGGGIGTHAIAAALLPQVRTVEFVDLNPLNRAFVAHRVAELGLTNVEVREAPARSAYDTILCFDVLEHLADPVAQLRRFFELLRPDGVLICNWYFSRGANGEYPFHQDDPAVVRSFFLHLQLNFIEEFHPHLITTRCYRLHPHRRVEGRYMWCAAEALEESTTETTSTTTCATTKRSTVDATDEATSASTSTTTERSTVDAAEKTAAA